MQVCGPETRRESLSSSLSSDHYSFSRSPGLLVFSVMCFILAVILTSYSLTTRARDGQGRPGSPVCSAQHDEEDPPRGNNHCDAAKKGRAEIKGFDETVLEL